MATKVAKILTTIVLQILKIKKKKNHFFSTTTTTTFDLHAQKMLKRKRSVQLFFFKKAQRSLTNNKQTIK
jgi:hypothetical protein